MASAGLAACATYVVAAHAGGERPAANVPIVRQASIEVAPASAVTALPMPPDPDPAEQARRADAALVGELMRDAWIHPIAGPNRRMPRNHTGAFGAVRDRDPPPECLSGHCGVDVGRIWGEPIHAVHDGVVDWVNLGPNEERGGVFVKLAHRDGTVFSWYFHLAGVPREIRRGAKVRVGQVIGLLGDTGIKRSAPHLHFAITVKPSKTARERYIDPEPLLAIWPLWMPDADRTDGRLTASVPPGLPVRAPARRKRRASKRAPPPIAAAAAEPALPDATRPDEPTATTVGSTDPAN